MLILTRLESVPSHWALQRSDQLRSQARIFQRDKLAFDDLSLLQHCVPRLASAPVDEGAVSSRIRRCMYALLDTIQDTSNSSRSRLFVETHSEGLSVRLIPFLISCMFYEVYQRCMEDREKLTILFWRDIARQLHKRNGIMVGRGFGFSR